MRVTRKIPKAINRAKETRPIDSRFKNVFKSLPEVCLYLQIIVYIKQLLLKTMDNPYLIVLSPSFITYLH